MIKQVAKTFGVKDQTKLNNAIDLAFNKANSSNPLEGVDKNFIQQFKNEMNNPKYEKYFEMFGQDKNKCNSFLDSHLNGGTVQQNTAKIDNTTNKYKNGLKQFK